MKKTYLVIALTHADRKMRHSHLLHMPTLRRHGNGNGNQSSLGRRLSQEAEHHCGTFSANCTHYNKVVFEYTHFSCQQVKACYHCHGS